VSKTVAARGFGQRRTAGLERLTNRRRNQGRGQAGLKIAAGFEAAEEI